MTLDTAYQAVIDAHLARWPRHVGMRDPSITVAGAGHRATVDTPEGEMGVNAPTAEQALRALADDIAGIDDAQLRADVQYARYARARNEGQLAADQAAWAMANIVAGRSAGDGGPGNDLPLVPTHPQGGPPDQRP